MPLLKSLKKNRKALDSCKFACDIFIDPQKAFDTVNHEIVLRKLDQYVGLVGAQTPRLNLIR